ncbi:hypothetical protein BP00DRAFT_480975 [Aspergillus indologenus CBS 114.80]|uniref:Helitron helicase-like domain-containing protein n=1 Tax=Aspergillus indologenus CBS 114.80 TaxID=1450541 RepID=A0A2V5I3F4_9EURO|nr:hypothetical protein BP00DRAFT_480975 [Aspergillus indologenus CBS 114.80]
MQAVQMSAQASVLAAAAIARERALTYRAHAREAEEAEAEEFEAAGGAPGRETGTPDTTNTIDLLDQQLDLEEYARQEAALAAILAGPRGEHRPLDGGLSWKGGAESLRRSGPPPRGGEWFTAVVIQERAEQEQRNLYSCLMDFMAYTDGSVSAEEIRRRVILPSGFVGSPCYMQQLFPDAMAIVQVYDLLLLFITITANSYWPEITNKLLPGQTADSCPDLTARVFELKKRELIGQIKDKSIFGPAPARFWTLEYQKCGLPYCYLIVFLTDCDQFLDPAVIDEVTDRKNKRPGSVPPKLI